MVALEPNPRNRLILKPLYYAGIRVSEVCRLRSKDVQARGEEAQITVFGKGGKTRSVLLQAQFWNELTSFRGEADEDDPVFQSRARRGHPLDQSQVLRVVQQASLRAGNEKNVSPYLSKVLDPVELNKPLGLSAIFGAETSPADDEDHWMLSLQFGEPPAFRAVVGKLVVGEDRSWNNVK